VSVDIVFNPVLCNSSILIYLTLSKPPSPHSIIIALLSSTYDISTLVITALALLSLTRSFQCIDSSTSLNIGCHLCGQRKPISPSHALQSSKRDNMYICNGSAESFKQALSGFSSSLVWLIFFSFHLGKAVETTRLGKRASLMLIRSLGNSMLGLGYALELSGT
jgi:DASS family divalent anion:Na+ symporter